MEIVNKWVSNMLFDNNWSFQYMIAEVVDSLMRQELPAHLSMKWCVILFGQTYWQIQTEDFQYPDTLYEPAYQVNVVWESISDQIISLYYVINHRNIYIHPYNMVMISLFRREYFYYKYCLDAMHPSNLGIGHDCSGSQKI